MGKNEIKVKFTHSKAVFSLVFPLILIVFTCKQLFKNYLLSRNFMSSLTILNVILSGFIILYLAYFTFTLLRLINKKIKMENSSIKYTEGILGSSKIRTINLGDVTKISFKQTYSTWSVIFYGDLFLPTTGNTLCFIYKDGRQEKLSVKGFDLQGVYSLLSDIEKKYPGLTRSV